uniref:Neuron navigator 1 n=1 Tax=Aceria tosichella TaxID=561515 RepID=A0A6G1SGE3_9ACAR
MDHHTSGRQPRSNSIGGQEFHHLGGEYHSQRLKQQTHALHSRFVDSNQFYNQKVRDYGGSSQYNHNITADRSISPSGLTSGGGRPADFYVPKRSSSIKYPLDKQQPLARNQIHASLECLNTIYSDYGQQNQKQQSLSNHHPRQYTQHLHLQQQQHQQQQPFKHRPSFQSNHYANTYVLSAVPTDTIVNQSAEQDLAAAAMASPQHYQPILSSGGGSISSSKMDGSMSQSPQSHSHYLAQGSFNNRSTVPISHSPLHRRIVPGPMASILNQITSSTSNPLRAGHSSLSLASSTYLIEDKLQNEIKQLQSELKSEKEKNEALSSQLNINSNLMAAFEQSLTTLNSRLRQVTAISERKDRELELLRSQLDSSNRLAVVESSCETSEKSTSPINGPQNGNLDHDAAAVHLSKSHATSQPVDKNGVDDQTGARDEQTLLKIIEDLKRQLIEKDRLLTDTRLEALSAAHQLEQLESRMNGEQSMMANEDDLDEGVMVVNHSPSDSDAITDSAHFGDQHNTLSHRSSHYDHSNHSADHHHHQQSQPMQAHQHKSQKDCNNSLEDMILFTPTQGHKTTSSESRAGGGGGLSGTSSNQSNDDTHEMMHLHRKQRQLDSHSDQSSSDYHDDDKSPGDMTSQQQEFGARNNGTAGQTFEAHDGKTMNKMLDKLLVSN